MGKRRKQGKSKLYNMFVIRDNYRKNPLNGPYAIQKRHTISISKKVAAFPPEREVMRGSS